MGITLVDRPANYLFPNIAEIHRVQNELGHNTPAGGNLFQKGIEVNGLLYAVSCGTLFADGSY